MGLHQYHLQSKWKFYSDNLCKRIWESLILASEAGGGIKQQDCKANSCFLLAPLLILLPRAEDGAPSIKRRSWVPGRSTAGWSRVQGQLTRAARSLQSLQHFPASPKALLGMAQHSLQKICCGRAAGEMEPSVGGENTQTIVWEKPSTSHQFHPWVKTPFFHPLEPTPKTSGRRSWRDHLLLNRCWFLPLLHKQRQSQHKTRPVESLWASQHRQNVQSTQKWIGKRRSFPREKDTELQVQGAPGGSKCSSPEKCRFKVTSGNGCN